MLHNLPILISIAMVSPISSVLTVREIFSFLIFICLPQEDGLSIGHTLLFFQKLWIGFRSWIIITMVWKICSQVLLPLEYREYLFIKVLTKMANGLSQYKKSLDNFIYRYIHKIN